MMWHYWGAMGPFGWTMMIILWSGIIVLILWSVRSASPTRGVSNLDAALTLLERRFASGEIEQAEFEEKRRVLQQQ
jgi:putative membrane protein